MNRLITRQISRRVEKFRKVFVDPMPHKGWIYAIRSAFGITLEQLGEKMGSSYQSAQNLEAREVTGSPRLKTMRAVGDALDCQFVYAFIPKIPIEKMLDAQAEKKARAIIEQVDHSMALENQAVSREELETQIKILKENLKRGNLNKIWE